MSYPFSHHINRRLCSLLLLIALAGCGGAAVTPTPTSGGAATATAGDSPEGAAVAPTESLPATPVASPTEAVTAGPEAQVMAYVTALSQATQDTSIHEATTQERWADTMSALVAPSKRETVRKELLSSLNDLAESYHGVPGVPADAEIQFGLSFEDVETTLVATTETTAEVHLTGGTAKGVFIGKDVAKVPAAVQSEAAVGQPLTEFFGASATFLLENVDGVWYLSDALTGGAASSAGDSPSGTPAEGASRAAPLALGSAVPLQSWAITISDVLRGEEALKVVKAGSEFNADPPEGFEYLVATVELAYIGTEKEAQSVDAAVSLGVTGDKNILYSQEFLSMEKELEGELFAGSSASGQKAFLVPVDESNLMFYVRDYSSFERGDGRFIALDEGASITGDVSTLDTPASDVGAAKDEPARLGDPVLAAGWEVTVLEVKTGEEAAALVKQGSEFNDEAPSGFSYVAVKLSARYLGVESVDEPRIIDGLDFSITGAKGVVHEKVFVIEPNPALGATLFPGAGTEGWVILAAPTNETGLVLIYEPTFDDEDARYLNLE